MINTFSTALSALNANAQAVDTIGNNLANLNTTGYKTNVTTFHDMVAQSIGTTSGVQSSGMGVGRPDVTRQFTQGAVQTSGGLLDAAIHGDGFFAVRNPSGQLLLTRAGNFRLDKEGNLRTATGEAVQGWTAQGGALNTTAAASGIRLPVGALRTPAATTKMSVDFNLNAAAAVDSPDASFSTPVEVVDSLGTKHNVTLTFTKTDANTWSYQATIPGADVTDGEAGVPYEIPDASGTLTFDAQGKLTEPAVEDGVIPISIPGLVSGAADLSINWNLYDGQTPLVTQFSQSSAASTATQDGASVAEITKISMADGGQVVAQYSNGQQVVLAQVAVAAVRNPDSLIAVGNNNFQVGPDTAEPVIGTPETSGRGKIVGGALEASTVDIAREFTNLIVMQRSYQANARVITTSDELSQETLSLKR